MNRPVIHRVTGQFFKAGKCEVCGGSAERLKTFASTISYEDMIRQGEAWSLDEPIRHRRCE